MALAYENSTSWKENRVWSTIYNLLTTI
jgi:hypothetical protein